VAAWFLAFIAFLGSLAALVAAREWLRPLMAVAATYATTLALVFAMPPLWLDALAVVGSWAALWWLRRRSDRALPRRRDP
jgi:hypothetical protein